MCGVYSGTVTKPDAAHAATSMKSLKRALVNIVRVREGASLLQSRLDENLLSGFQDGVKLLVILMYYVLYHICCKLCHAYYVVCKI